MTEEMTLAHAKLILTHECHEAGITNPNARNAVRRHYVEAEKRVGAILAIEECRHMIRGVQRAMQAIEREEIDNCYTCPTCRHIVTPESVCDCSAETAREIDAICEPMDAPTDDILRHHPDDLPTEHPRGGALRQFVSMFLFGVLVMAAAGAGWLLWVYGILPMMRGTE